jgi:hypothetical protein
MSIYIQELSVTSVSGVAHVAAIFAVLVHLGLRSRQPGEARPKVIGAAAALVALVVPLLGGLRYAASWSGSGGGLAVRLSLGTLSCWPVAVALILLALRCDGDAGVDEARWPRLLPALFVDLIIYTVATVVPMCAAALIVEWQSVGSFSWQFLREFSRPSDLLFMASALAAGAAVWALPGILFWAGRPSVGSLLAGVEFRTTGELSVWRYAAFGLFNYVHLAAPVFPSIRDLGVSAVHRRDA